MALAIVQETDGPRIAAEVARGMVVHVRRAGSDSQVSLDTLASIAGMSRRHLSRRFRLATGVSVAQYRTQIRLEHARTLLRDTNLTVDEIAERCGLTDGRQLRRIWRETHGASPRG